MIFDKDTNVFDLMDVRVAERIVVSDMKEESGVMYIHFTRPYHHLAEGDVPLDTLWQDLQETNGQADIDSAAVELIVVHDD